MKNQNGMGHITLIITILIIVLVIVGIVVFVNNKVEDEKIETIRTNMLLIQGKVKVLSQEAIIQKNEGLLKGRKVSENIEDEIVKELIDKGIIAQDNLSKYYIIDNEIINELGIEKAKLEDGFYIVNYDTDEIIYSKGFEINKEKFYKLSDIKNINV